MVMDLKKFVMVILIMSIFMFGVSNFVGDLSQTFPNTGMQNTSYMDKSTALNEKIGEMQEAMQENPSKLSIAEMMLTGVWKVLTLVFDTLDIFISLINDMFATVGLGGFAPIFVGLLTVFIIFEIVYLVLNMRQ